MVVDYLRCSPDLSVFIMIIELAGRCLPCTAYIYIWKVWTERVGIDNMYGTYIYIMLINALLEFYHLSLQH